MGTSALVEAAQAWLAWAPLFVTVLALALVALALRLRVALAATRRYDANGSGRWLDGRTCTRGTLSIDGSGALRPLARYTALARSAHAETRPVALTTELRLSLHDGRVLRVDPGAFVQFELGTEAKIAHRVTVSSQGRGSEKTKTVDVLAKDGAPVWLVAKTHAPVDDGAMRSGAQIELASTDGVELHFARPEPPEARCFAPYVLLCVALFTQAWFGFAEGWTDALLVAQGLFALAAISSVKNTLGFQRALSAQTPAR
jgi:hypothetical protein